MAKKASAKAARRKEPDPLDVAAANLKDAAIGISAALFTNVSVAGPDTVVCQNLSSALKLIGQAVSCVEQPTAIR